jgi:lipid-binding SYLF domain-containing protein
MSRKADTLRWLVVACALVAGGWQVSAQSDEVERVREAATVFDEIEGVPDKAIPLSILQKAEAIAVFPGTIKAGLGIGGQRGRGIVSARRPNGNWSSPAFLTLTGGSFGLQIGAQATDIVLVIMNRRGLDNLLGNEFKIGAETSIAAGPVGRSAEASTDIQLRAEILSYSRARGLFAGVSLAGSAVREDEDANKAFYGRPLRNREIVNAPDAVGTSGGDSVQALGVWRDTLSKYVK